MDDGDENADELILLTHLSRELQAAGYEPVDYGRSYRGALSARYPCEQDQNGRWIIRRGNLPKVVAALGLKPLGDLPTAKRQRRTAVIAA